ncbi:MAG: cytochrome c oxidase subunit 3 [Bacteroidota bacterium]
MAGEATKAIDKSLLWGGGRSPFSVSYGKMMMWFFLVSDALTFSGLLVAYGYARMATTGTWPIGEEVFHALPGLHGNYPLIYVALMTFILIISSVTMVLAVEAGHRMDKKGVTKWLGLTIIGGFFFLGSQAWEWSHFIHGSAGYITTETGEVFFLSEEVPHGMTAADVEGFTLIANQGEETESVISGAAAIALFDDRVDYIQGANMTINEYGPPQYANFFFFITGFHGFHVFSGVVINIIVFLGVTKGIYERRGHYEMVEKTGLYWHFVDLVWVFVFTFFYLI